MDKAAFLSRFGHLFEHSPWVVERAWAYRPFADPDALYDAFLQVLADATEEERLALVQAHPRLADKAQIAEGLTADSAAEQASAGLTALTPDEFRLFHGLNNVYSDRLGFPFVICVRLHDKAAILRIMGERVERDRPTELAAAIVQVGLIARMRLGLVPWEALA
jgi:2-oxo-4-hydroxy-4-carboxy-5-ureidoimidazoline decarboxylase